MKSINKAVLSILSILISTFLWGQYATLAPLQCSSYTSEPEMDKFVGHWKWTSGDDSFEMILKKEKMYNTAEDNSTCVDRIIGFHQNIKNGLVTESNLQFQHTSSIEDKQSLFSSRANYETLKGIFTILSTSYWLDIELEYIDNNHIKLKSLKNRPGTKVYLNGKPVPNTDINIPQNILLTRQ